MAKTKTEPTAESPEEIVLEDNQIICLLTGDIKAAKPKEETLQSVIRMLNEEYGFDMTDMQRDFTIAGFDPDSGKNKKLKIDLAIFEEGKAHEQENIIRLCIVQDEKIKETDSKTVWNLLFKML
ncbi:MAG: hypothetical protein IPN43_07760 [Chitinophagaceae bacterium]|nr:hypothetical protein [Chitinophagaceae bacterium]